MGLGIGCLVCLGVLFFTGITLFLYYVPDQGKAYERILHITTTLHFGGLIRNLHFVAANALLVLAILHLARVFLTGSYKDRWLNWSYGLVLLVIILLANFTGYLLPWDQISYWAIKVGANLAAYVPIVGTWIKSFMLAGEEIGNETLLRSFALHAGVLPLTMVVFASLHLWRIRKDGGLAASEHKDNESLPADPWLFRAEGAVALLTLSALIILTIFFEAPIFERADPQHPPNPAKAPWYFVGFQEMVSYSALIGGVVTPMLLGLFLLFAPVLDRSKKLGGKWFSRDRVWINILFIIFFLSQTAFIIIGGWFRGKNWVLQLPF
jgi:quinol-cytochrome oxidoreductase complex cytochrome b subunit